jgi:SAM-dependent methyltransferase
MDEAKRLRVVDEAEYKVARQAWNPILENAKRVVKEHGRFPATVFTVDGKMGHIEAVGKPFRDFETGRLVRGKFDPQDLRRVVDGSLGTMELPGRWMLIFNENGLLEDLPVNKLASETFGFELVGNVILAEGKFIW